MIAAPHFGHFSGVAVEVPALLSCNSIRKVQPSAEHIAIGGMRKPRWLDNRPVIVTSMAYVAVRPLDYKALAPGIPAPTCP